MQILLRLQQRHGLNSTSAFDLLAELGRDCAGAIQLMPAGGNPQNHRRIDAQPLNEAEVAQVLRNTVRADCRGSRDTDEYRLSIAGAQEKTALLWHENTWCKPLDATPSSHIFKLPLGLVAGVQAELRDSVELEWLSLEILREYGLSVASVAIGQFEEQKVLIVERFDRELRGSWWLRTPQEDFCQVFGMPPSCKYEADGGPGVRRIMDALRGSEHADRDRWDFFTAQFLFWLMAATDGHGKNFSLQIGPGGSYWLAPLYDVLSIYPIMGRAANQIDPREARLAMAVEGRNRHYRLYDIHRWHWVQMAARLGLNRGHNGSQNWRSGHLRFSMPLQRACRHDFPPTFSTPSTKA